MRARVRYGGAPAQLHAGKAYDIAGRPPVLRRRGNCSREQGTGGWPMVRGWPRAQPAVGLTRDWWSVEGKVPHESTACE
jgi:hypothetical protein